MGKRDCVKHHHRDFVMWVKWAPPPPPPRSIPRAARPPNLHLLVELNCILHARLYCSKR